MISKHALLVFHVEAMQMLDGFPWFDGWHLWLSTNVAEQTTSKKLMFIFILLLHD